MDQRVVGFSVDSGATRTAVSCRVSAADVRFSALFLSAAMLLAVAPARAASTDCATDWANFANNPGFVAEYTSDGAVIADEETSSDASHGPAAIPPAWTDLASGSPGSFPGPEATSFFGYYNGGTVYDPADPVTMEDDVIFFRMRLEGDPSKGAAFDSKHWNILFDTDADGYKDFWIDLDGSTANGPVNADALKILYDDANRQDIPDPVAAEVESFTAFHTEDDDASCTASSPGLSHTRSYAVADGTPDYYIEFQVPMTAFDDLQGNQVLFPDSPVAFVFSTGASNQDPLQKDFMKDLEFLTLSDPISFGDVIIPNGRPLIEFVDASLQATDFYVQGDAIYVKLTDRFANTDSTVVECVSVTVTDPTTGDDELVTLCETTPSSGIFTSLGGACDTSFVSPSPAPSPPTAWLVAVRTSSSTLAEDWTVTFNAGNWDVVGSVSGFQGTASHGVAFASANGAVSFTLYENGPAVPTELTFCTVAADPLTSSGTPGADEDGDLYVVGGEDITVSYTNVNSVTVTDDALIVAACQAVIQFTRANGDPSTNFQLGPDPASSDQLYVTVILRDANTDSGVAETIQVVLTGYDTQTLTLTEAGPDTGEFRNAAGLETQVSDGVVTPEDDLWEDIDGGTVTATYDYTCGGSSFSPSATASLFFINGAGRVYFTNGAGTLDVDLYGSNVPVFLKVTDETACTTTVVLGGTPTETVVVVVTTDAGDSENVTLYETFAGSGVFMNRINDLVTTASSAVVTAVSATFVTDGLSVGDLFAVATGPDAGLHTVASVQSETQLTLAAALTASRTGIGYDATPLLTAVNDGTVVADDDVLEADHEDGYLVTYTDCDDGDLDASNDIKTDSATFNAPQLMLDWVLFYPDTDLNTACLTESIEVLNSTSNPVTATGYELRDADTFSYTIPLFGGADLILQSGERIFVSLWNSTPPADFFDSTSATYFLFSAGPGPVPPDELGDPASGDAADQVLLLDPSNVVQDYVGWSATVTPSVDFYGDDSPAVLRSIWLDDSFKDVSGISLDDVLQRSPSGFDTNTPGDWFVSADAGACAVLATRAVIASVRAFRDTDGVVVQWETSSEEGTIGFDVRRAVFGGGREVRVNDALVPSPQAPQGATYSVLDRGAANDGTLRYVLVEHEVGPRGQRTRRHGPYDVVVEDLPQNELKGEPRVEWSSGMHAHGRGVPHEAQRSQQARLDAHAQVRAQRPVSAGKTADRVKLSVREDGMYAVQAQELASRLGVPVQRLRAAIRAGQLSVTQGGAPIAWTADPGAEGLSFYGQSIDEVNIYTQDNAYWVTLGRGRVMDEVAGRPPGQPGRATHFRDTLHLEENHFPVTNGGGDPESDFWYWAFVVPGYPAYETYTVPFAIPDLAAGADTGAYLVNLKGGSSLGIVGEHHVEIHVNGQIVGEGTFTGFNSFSVSGAIDASVLGVEGNTLQIVGRADTGAAFSLFYVESVDVHYPRRYRARDGALAFSGDEKVITVDGFTEANVAVFDITEPRIPRRMDAVRVSPAPDGFSVSVANPEPGREYLAVSEAAIAPPDRATAVRDSGLRSPRNSADYLVIAPTELVAAAEELAAYRRSGGFESRVVSFEQIVDTFGHGLRTPHAIRSFLSHAARRWQRPPRYVVLIGAGHFDHKGYMLSEGNLLPPLLAESEQGFYATDNSLADIEGHDGVPEMAIGRIPVVTSEELRAYIAKIQAFEAQDGAAWRNRAVLLADDNPGGDGHFGRDSESMAAFLPASLDVQRLYLSQQEASSVRTDLHIALQEGAGLLSFVGHGGFDRLTDEAVLHVSDIPGLDNAGRTPIVMALTCVVNRFALPGLASIGELLVVEPEGGAVAVWGPSGISQEREAAVLGRALFEVAFGEGRPRLGDAVRQALVSYAGPGSDEHMTRIYNLLGDPALELPAPR